MLLLFHTGLVQNPFEGKVEKRGLSVCAYLRVGSYSKVGTYLNRYGKFLYLKYTRTDHDSFLFEELVTFLLLVF